MPIFRSEYEDKLKDLSFACMLVDSSSNEPNVLARPSRKRMAYNQYLSLLKLVSRRPESYPSLASSGNAKSSDTNKPQTTLLIPVGQATVPVFSTTIFHVRNNFNTH